MKKNKSLIWWLLLATTAAFLAVYGNFAGEVIAGLVLASLMIIFFLHIVQFLLFDFVVGWNRNMKYIIPVVIGVIIYFIFHPILGLGAYVLLHVVVSFLGHYARPERDKIVVSFKKK